MNAAANNAEGCLLCKYQSKRCTAQCIFAPYFTPDRANEFGDVICLIGIRNLRKLLRSVSLGDRDRTMESIIREGRLRMESGAHGSLAALKKLQDRIEETQREIDSVNEKIRLLKDEGCSGEKSSSEENVSLWPVDFQ